MKTVTIMKKGGSLSPSKAREMLKDGTSNGKPLTDKQRRFFGWKASQAQNGLAIEGDKFTPISNDTIMINGKSHKKGGTDLIYNGTPVEAEAGEPLSINGNGEAIIYGNMKNPLTNRKFKSDAKIIAQKESKMDRLLAKGTGLVNNSDPYDKWDVLKFNAGRAMSSGASTKLRELKESKEHLAILQDAMLEKADELGVDPEAFSNGKMKAQNGTRLSLAERNNNPGNLKYRPWMKKYGAVPGQAGTDGGNFAVFPTVGAGQEAMLNLIKTGKPYKNATVAEAINTWTGGEPYKIIPANIKDKKVQDLNDNEFRSLLDTITQGEDSKKYNWDGVQSVSPNPPSYVPPALYNAPSVSPPTVPGSRPTPNRRIGAPRPYNLTLEEDPQISVPSNAENFDYFQIVPELYAAATNRVEPVFAQTYSPDLYQPYSVSFQDRRNLNNQTFRAVSQRVTDNPGALSTLAAQKYEADNQVNAEEFRTNQAIYNDVLDKNTQLLNNAQLKNLQIADTQYTRQAQAKSKTKATNQVVLNSITDKVAKHNLENRTLQLYENLYPNFRYDDNYQLQKVGESGFNQINWGGVTPISNYNPATSTRVTRDAYGRVTKVSESTPSEVKQQLDNTKLNKSLSQMLKDGDLLFNTKTKGVETRYNNNYSPLKGYDYSR